MQFCPWRVERRPQCRVQRLPQCPSCYCCLCSCSCPLPAFTLSVPQEKIRVRDRRDVFTFSGRVSLTIAHHPTPTLSDLFIAVGLSACRSRSSVWLLLYTSSIHRCRCAAVAGLCFYCAFGACTDRPSIRRPSDRPRLLHSCH